MAYLINLQTRSDDRGDLTVIEKILPFDIKRVFFIYNINKNMERGGHRHNVTFQGLICINGACIVISENSKSKEKYLLDSPEKCLILEPEDWHVMKDFKDNTILLVLASEYYDKDDYIYDKYDNN